MNDNLKSTSAIMREFDRVLSGGRAGIVGTKIQVAGRTFEAIATEPYTRLNGAASLLVRWHGSCAACGTAYEVMGSRNGAHLAINCEAHRGKRRHRANPLRRKGEAIARALLAIDAGKIAKARRILNAALSWKGGE
jgi:hypothetical protein